MHDSFLRVLPGCAGQEFDGRQRVIIEQVSPRPEEGCFPAKAVEGASVRVGADIFVDGADRISAELCWRREGDEEWQRVPMTPGENDRWQGSFTAGAPGRMEFTIEAWVDHFATWLGGLRKKLDAAQDVALELETGARIVEARAKLASAEDAGQLRAFAEAIRGDARRKGVDAALDAALAMLMDRNPDRTLASRYQRTLPVEVEPVRAGFSTWYEFFPRSWAAEPGAHGTFDDCRALLPRIAAMGFDVIYLPPIHPIGTTKRKGRNNALQAAEGDPGSCWAIGSPDGGHKAVHPELGTLETFRSFVADAREHGISVALDIAFQCSPDHPWVKEHPQWFRWRPDGTVQFAENPPKRYEDILPIDFETDDWENLWLELRSVMLFWIEQGVTIFRVDNPHTKAFGFWEWAIASIRREHPDTLFLAEAFTRPKLMARLARAGYSHSYTYFTWRNTKHELQEYLEELTRPPLVDFMRPNFWPNTPDILHEELQSGLRPKFISRLVLAATLSSNYGMYGPAYELCEHVPFPGKEEYIDSEKYEIKAWDLDRPGNIRAEIALVNRIRHENAALQQTRDIAFVRVDRAEHQEHDQLIAYVKWSEEGKSIILTVVNLDPSNTQAGWLRFPLERFGLPHTHPFRVEELLTGATYSWNGEWNYISLDPGTMPAHIFRVGLT